MKRTLIIQASTVILFLASATMADPACHYFYRGQKIDVLKLIGLDNTRASVDRLMTEDDASQILWSIIRESKTKTIKPSVPELKKGVEAEISEWIAFNGSLANVAKHYNSEHTLLTKNEVWAIYSSYQRLKRHKENLEDNGSFQAKATDALIYSIDMLEKTLAETGFFARLETGGYSLKRPSGEKKKETLPSDWKTKFQMLQFRTQFAKINLSGQIGFDSMYSDSLRQRLMNGGMRRRLPTNFIKLMKETNSILGEFVDTFDLKTTDIDRAVAIIDQVDSIINRPEFQRYQEMNRASLFASARANAATLDTHLSQYNVLSKLIRPYNASISQAVRHVEIYDAKEIKEIKMEMIKGLYKKNTNVFSLGTDVVGLAQRLENLTKEISAENVKVDSASLTEFAGLKDFVLTVTKDVPTRKLLSGFSAYSSSEVAAANKMRAEITRLETLLTGRN